MVLTHTKVAVDTLRDSEVGHRDTMLATLPSGGPSGRVIWQEREYVAKGGDGAMRTASRNVLAIAAVLAAWDGLGFFDGESEVGAARVAAAVETTPAAAG